jgi:hypothetical protein
MRPVTYRPAPGVRWAVEEDGILLDDGAGCIAKVGYPDAAVWDFMVRGYRYGQLVELMTHIAGLDEAAAGELVGECLERWAEGGVLRKGLAADG